MAIHRVIGRIGASAGALLLAAGCGAGARHQLAVGVVDDAARSADAPGFLGQLTNAGFDALAVSSVWEPGRREPDATETASLRRVAATADAAGVRLFVIIYQPGSATTPLTDVTRSDFASYSAAVARKVPAVRDLIIGNEPNLNRFWLPQFGPGGRNVSAAAYLALLASTYDAVKAVREEVRVWGGATAPRGSDRARTARETTSPTAFVRALGAAYRQSGRDRPVMDGFVHHPYPDSARVPIDLRHPRVTTIGLADYSKLVRLLTHAFDGTAQHGSDLPILYGEIGVETAIPPARRALYTGREIAATISEHQQAAAYRRTLELAACQPNVAGVLFFHLRDEPSLIGWQSGVLYTDGTPKQSLPSARAAAANARSGDLEAECAS